MFQVSTHEGVRNIVPTVARLVKQYGDPFLSGRAAFYDELQKTNERASVTFEREQLGRRGYEHDVSVGKDCGRHL